MEQQHEAVQSLCKKGEQSLESFAKKKEKCLEDLETAEVERPQLEGDDPREAV